MAGIQEATSAFAQTIGGSAPSRSSNDSQTVEQVGGDWDESEVAGGDDEPVEGEVEDTEDKATEDAPADEEEGEGEASEEEEDGEDEGEESGEGPDLNAKVEIVIDGKPAEVSLREAVDGYIRQQTFHQRLNEVNELKKNVENEASTVAKAREVYGEMLTALKEQLDSLTPAEPDWDKMYAENPVEASRAERQWNKFKEQRAAIDQERVRVAQESQQEQIKNLTKFVEAEREKLRTIHPEWTDAKVWERDRTSMAKTAKAAGLSDQEIGSIYDSRYMEVLLKASKYDRLMANKPKPVTSGPKPLRPGAGASRTTPKGSAKASSRLAKTGSLRDAADVFGGMLKNER